VFPILLAAADDLPRMSDHAVPALTGPIKALKLVPSSVDEGERPARAAASADSAPVSWLISDGMDRERMLDMDRLVAPVRQKSFVVMTIALLMCGPWLGWWTVALLAVAGVLFKVADWAIERVSHPEYLLFAAWAGSQLMIALAAVLTGGPHSPALAWFAIPIVTLSARFPTRGVILGLGVTIAMMVTVAFATGAHEVIAKPPLLIMPLALSIAVAILSTALMQSDVIHRSEAVIDPLTGMLNRNSLKDRTFELSHQSERTGQPVGLIVGDLDHFKQVNDSYGHATGDAVLQDVAYLLRKQLRAFDLAYRIGGEEFLVLLPGADLEQSMAMAERLRAGVQADTVGGGLRVTMSFGVSASVRERAFDYTRVCEQADGALYEAKRQGRNRVCGSTAQQIAHPQPA
jgi:diguanylate cyclase (GGDEF)-like protein